MARNAWAMATPTADKYTPDELRRLDAPLLFPGADALGARSGVRPGSTPASISGTTVTVNPCSGVVSPTAAPWLTTGGAYRWVCLADELSISPADTSTRIDLLVARILDADVDGGTTERQAVPVIIEGVPGGGTPAMGAADALIGTITVPANGSPAPSMVPGPVTVASGGVLPVADATGLPAVGRYAGMTAWRSDVKQLVVWDGSAWVYTNPVNTATVGDEEVGNFEFTNVSFDVTFSSGTYVDCAVSWTAPLSGRVVLHFGAGIYHLATGQSTAQARMAPQTRTGSTVGSGTIVQDASNGGGIRTNNFEGDNNSLQFGRSRLMSGLVAGNSYNTRLLHRVSSGTGILFDRYLIVEPVA